MSATGKLNARIVIYIYEWYEIELHVVKKVQSFTL